MGLTGGLAVVLTYFDYMRSRWPRWLASTVATSIVANGLSPWFAKATAGNEQIAYYAELLVNTEQSESFSAFCIVFGFAALWVALTKIK
ncbi:hypothetical protein CA85_17700 [Allorhodopirellula solitaria]|uniref:Uncharacterized protein n=2 Tax=Allorhodopirellula solitaria TaxID=2527987 RepID=A0A5C5YHU5_9BACT|nr:hypothetical protein CA85_17700 [Allorhodopirellula solitaria]